MPCPVCLTKRGTPCGACGARGMFSEETTINCTADTLFSILTGSLPSGFNRTLERIGIVNLPKGHADIETYIPDEDELHDMAEKKAKPEVPPLIYYRARVPYADLRISFKKQMATASAFGKRCVLGGVPYFLDDALSLARDNLARTARGIAKIESATSARAIRDSIALHISGKSTVNDLRRLYPYGLSPEVAKEITTNAKLAISRTTLRLRMIAAAVITAVGLGGTAFLYLTPLHAQLTQGQPLRVIMMADLAFPALLAIAGWVFLGLAARMALKNKFPSLKQVFIQKTGKTGMAMMVVLVLGWAGILYLSKSLWLFNIIHR